jgi:hypothetical protein
MHRAAVGQWGLKDSHTGLAGFVTCLSLETYIRAILLVCAAHALVTYEADALEAGEVAWAGGVWLTATLGPVLVLLAGVHGLAGFVAHGALGSRSLGPALWLQCGALAAALWLVGADLVGGGLSAWAD